MTKRKSNAAGWGLALMLLAPVGVAVAAPATSRPVSIPVSPDAQVHVALSNTNPNLLVVPGDRIIAVDSASGMFLNDNMAMGQANGGVQLMTAQKKPFTFYLRTAGGLTVSVVGVPENRQGRVLHFVSNRPVKHEAARQWETEQPYPRALVALQKALLRGAVPEGYSEAPVAGLPAFNLPGALSVQAQQMWNGGELRVYRLSVTNRSTAVMLLPERLFRAPGVRAVMIFPYGTSLLPGATAGVWVTASGGEDS